MSDIDADNDQEQQMLDAIEKWLERDVRPHVLRLEHADEYPIEMVEQMKELGLFGATIMAMLSAFPEALVVAIAGLALMATIGNGLASALHKESDREAAMVTFLITLSGVVIGGVGSAFWGLLAGSLALVVQHYRPRKA